MNELQNKIFTMWNEIRSEMQCIQQRESAYQMRRRLNPHHPPKDIKLEYVNHMNAQVKAFADLKAHYVKHRNLLISDPEILQEFKPENDEWEKLIGQDMERIVFGADDQD